MMLEFPNEDFIPAIIKKPKGAIMNILEAHGNVGSLSKAIEGVKKGQMEVPELKL